MSQKESKKEKHKKKLAFSEERNSISKRLSESWKNGGMSKDTIDILKEITVQIYDFILRNVESQQMALPPMNSSLREIFKEMAKLLNISTTTRGSSSSKCLVLYKTSLTKIAEENEKNEVEFLAGCVWKTHKIDIKSVYSNPKYQIGKIIGEDAPKIPETNIGFKVFIHLFIYQMMTKMGWSVGEGIGKSKILMPDDAINAVIRKEREGLGS